METAMFIIAGMSHDTFQFTLYHLDLILNTNYSLLSSTYQIIQKKEEKKSMHTLFKIYK